MNHSGKTFYAIGIVELYWGMVFACQDRMHLKHDFPSTDVPRNAVKNLLLSDYCEVSEFIFFYGCANST